MAGLNPKLIVGTGVIIIALSLGYHFASRSGKKVEPITEETPQPTEQTAHLSTTSGELHVQETDTVALESPPPQPVSADWTTTVDELMRGTNEPAEVGKALVEMLPQLPPEGRMDVIQHAANLTADENYPPLGELFKDPKTSADELEILLADILNRPNEIKLPILLEVARNPEHPKALEARQILALFVGDDYGEDWFKWQDAISAVVAATSSAALSGQ